MFGDLLKSFISPEDKANAIEEVIKNASLRISKELGVPYSDFIIAIQIHEKTNEDGEVIQIPKYFINKKGPNGGMVFVRKLTIEEILQE